MEVVGNCGGRDLRIPDTGAQCDLIGRRPGRNRVAAVRGPRKPGGERRDSAAGSIPFPSAGVATRRRGADGFLGRGRGRCVSVRCAIQLPENVLCGFALKHHGRAPRLLFDLPSKFGEMVDRDQLLTGVLNEIEGIVQGGANRFDEPGLEAAFDGFLGMRQRGERGDSDAFANTRLGLCEQDSRCRALPCRGEPLERGLHGGKLGPRCRLGTQYREPLRRSGLTDRKRRRGFHRIAGVPMKSVHERGEYSGSAGKPCQSLDRGGDDAAVGLPQRGKQGRSGASGADLAEARRGGGANAVKGIGVQDARQRIDSRCVRSGDVSERLHGVQAAHHRRIVQSLGDDGGEGLIEPYVFFDEIVWIEVSPLRLEIERNIEFLAAQAIVDLHLLLFAAAAVEGEFDRHPKNFWHPGSELGLRNDHFFDSCGRIVVRLDAIVGVPGHEDPLVKKPAKFFAGGEANGLDQVFRDGGLSVMRDQVVMQGLKERFFLGCGTPGGLWAVDEVAQHIEHRGALFVRDGVEHLKRIGVMTVNDRPEIVVAVLR